MKKIVLFAGLALAVAASGAQAQSDTHDARSGLRSGTYGDSGQILTNAAEASSNMLLVGHQDKPPVFNGYGGPRGLTFAESDMAFRSLWGHMAPDS